MCVLHFLLGVYEYTAEPLQGIACGGVWFMSQDIYGCVESDLWMEISVTN
jgi:hypothetical protein